MLATAKTSDRVLSVPAGLTSHLIKQFRVHAYPVRYGYRLANVHYFTFRASGEGGRMPAVYHVDYQFDAHPNDPQLIIHVEQHDRERVAAYVTQRDAEGTFLDEKFRFLVLSTNDQELLPHRPAVQPGARGACYYTFGELRSGKHIVDVAR